MITVYNFPSAGHVARVGIAIILVGDSVAMVKIGHKASKNVYIDAMTESNGPSIVNIGNSGGCVTVLLLR